MNEDLIFEHHIKVAEMLGKMFSPILEVIVHDLRTPESSIIAIYNGHITGRKKGDGTSDMGYRRLKGKLPEMIINYKNETPSGKSLKSSTLTIRNSKNEVIGAICLNLDISFFEQYNKYIQFLTQTEEYEYTPQKEQFFLGNAKKEISLDFDQIRMKNGYHGKSLTTREKKEILQELIDLNHLNKRGAIAIISELLAVTRQTVYRYIKEMELNGNEKLMAEQ